MEDTTTKDISALEYKIAAFKELVEELKRDEEEKRDIVKKLEGFAFGHKDLLGKFEEHSRKQQDELVALAREGKISPPVATFVASFLSTSVRFIDAAEKEAQKLLAIRMGETLEMAARQEKLLTAVSSIESDLAALKAPPAPKQEIEEGAPSSSEDAVEASDTVSEKSEKNSRMSTKGQKKKIPQHKRPDEAAAVAETVKRLKKSWASRKPKESSET